MKIIKFFPYLLSLFLGFNKLSAQERDTLSVKQDTTKVYEFPEIEVSPKKSDKTPLRENSFINAMYINQINALELNPNVQRSIKLTSKILIQGIPVDRYGDFSIDGFSIKGKSEEGEISTKFDSKLFTLASLSTGYSTKYDALLGQVEARTLSYLEEDARIEYSYTPLKNDLFFNFPIKEFNSSIAFYFDIKEPFWPISRIPVTKYLPKTKSLQSKLELFDNFLDLSFYKFYSTTNINDNLKDNEVNLDKIDLHDIFIAKFRQDNLSLMVGYEWWDEFLTQSFNHNPSNRVGLGTKHYELNVEYKLDNNLLGLTYIYIRNNTLNDFLLDDSYIDKLFNEYLDKYGYNLGDEEKTRIIGMYTGTPNKYSTLVDILRIYGETYKKLIHNENDLKEFEDFSDKILYPYGKDFNYNKQKGVGAVKVYYDGFFFIEDLFKKELLVNYSIAGYNYKDNFNLLYGLKFDYLQDMFEIIATIDHQANYIERHNIRGIFKRDNNGLSQRANSYSASLILTFENSLINAFEFNSYFKEYYNINKEYGKTRGINLSLTKNDDFSYNLLFFLGRSELNQEPLELTVDKGVSLTTAYKFNEPFFLTACYLKFSLADGRWDKRNINGETEKLDKSMFFDLGLSKSFTLFKKDDICVSIAGYIPINTPLIRIYKDNGDYENINTPVTGNLELRFYH